MTEIKAKYTVKHKHPGWGGTRIAGQGKRMGPPTDIGSNPRRYQDYLDDETIAALKLIHPNRSLAIRTLAKNFLN